MPKVDDGIKVAIETGRLVRQIDAVIKGLNVMREELAKVEESYCPVHGDELIYMGPAFSIRKGAKDGATFGCPKCDYMRVRV